MLNEAVHVNTDPKFTELVNTVVECLKYDLYEKAIKGTIDVVDYDPDSVVPTDLRMAGKTFDEYFKDVLSNKERTVRLPLNCSFRILDKDNPCKDWISSDCVYNFRIERGISCEGASDITDAFVTNDKGSYCLHNVTFSFIAQVGSLSDLKSVIRHELKHAYTEFMYHKGMLGKLNDNVKRELGDQALGYFKDHDDLRRERDYDNITKIYKRFVSDNKMPFEVKCQVESAAFISKCLYYLFDKEISANYSTYYQECIDNPLLLSTEPSIYKAYSSLLRTITEGIYVVKTDGNEQKPVRIDPFDDDSVFDRMKLYAKFVLRHIPKTKDSFKEDIIKRITRVMDRMVRIHRYVHSHELSAYESYNDAIDSYYESLRETYINIYGEESGLVRYTYEKTYKLPNYSEAIDIIDKKILCD